MTAAIAGNLNSSAQENSPEEWRISGELIRQIGRATTWQRVIEAGDALMTVSRIASNMRSELDHHARCAAEASRNVKVWLCLGSHRWTGRADGDTCCPECGRRPSTEAPKE